MVQSDRRRGASETRTVPTARVHHKELLTLDRTGKTNYDYKNNFHLKLILPEGESTCDPEHKYSKTNTVNFFR